jgi:hypothetical protein
MNHGLQPGRTASIIEVTPAGEIIDTDGQSAFESLDLRTREDAFLESAQVNTRIFDDFYGANVADATVGLYGWSRAFSGTGAILSTVSDPPAPGVLGLSTGTTASGFCVLHLKLNAFTGIPIFTCEWRARAATALPDGTNSYVMSLGLTDISATGGALAPVDGYQFLSSSGGTWTIGVVDAQSVNGGAGHINTGVAVDLLYHRFRIRSTGAAVHFYIDGTEVTGSPITNAAWFPDSPGDLYSPQAGIEKLTSTAARLLHVDYFGLLLEPTGGR